MRIGKTKEQVIKDLAISNKIQALSEKEYAEFKKFDASTPELTQEDTWKAWTAHKAGKPYQTEHREIKSWIKGAQEASQKDADADAKKRADEIDKQWAKSHPKPAPKLTTLKKSHFEPKKGK